MRSNYAGIKLPSALCEENKNKLCRQVTSPMQLLNRSFKVANWEGTAAKCSTLKKARSKRANLLVFQLKYANC